MQLQTAAKNIIANLRHYLEQVDEKAYRQPVEALAQSTLGQHTRHALDFFQCITDQSREGVLNYDKRQRNHLIEENPQAAIEALDKILNHMETSFSDKPLLLQVSFSEKDDDALLIPTSFIREWSYAVEHAIHHMAIIRIGAKFVAPELSLPENFGIAASTIKYRKRQCAP